MLRTLCLALILLAYWAGAGLAQVPRTTGWGSPESAAVEHFPPVAPILAVTEPIVPQVEQTALELESEPAVPEMDPEPVPSSVETPWPNSWYDTSLWEGAFELGLAGSEGNSRTLNFHFGFDSKRKTTTSVFDVDLDYHRKTADSVQTAHRLFFDTRWERLFEESPWTWFIHHGTEYDEFTAYDVRLTFDTGIGRRLIETENASLLARMGVGGSHEIGGPDDSWVPEMVFGLDYEQQLTDRQKLTASADYTPDVTNFADFRLKSKVGWEILLDEDMNLSMRLSILDRYDSTPNGTEPNDLDYTLTLLWNF